MHSQDSYPLEGNKKGRTIMIAEVLPKESTSHNGLPSKGVLHKEGGITPLDLKIY